MTEFKYVSFSYKHYEIGDFNFTPYFAFLNPIMSSAYPLSGGY